MQPRKPRTSFDFTQAVGQVFQTSGGTGFAKRLLFWVAAGYSVTMLIAFLLMANNFGPYLDANWRNLQNLGSVPSPEETGALLSALGGLVPGYMVMIVGMWFSAASGEAALHRKVLLGRDTPGVLLKLNRDTGRVMLSQIGVWGLWCLAYFAGIFFLTISGALGALGVIIAFIGIIVLIGVLFLIPIRFAPAAALSIKQGELRLWSAKILTKHRFWNLFVAYLTVFLGGYVVLVLVAYMVMGLIMGDMSAVISLYGPGDTLPSEQLNGISRRLKNPVFMLIAVLGIILYATVTAIWGLIISGIASYAARWYFDDDEASPFD